jgi:hypothetical protein
VSRNQLIENVLSGKLNDKLLNITRLKNRLIKQNILPIQCSRCSLIAEQRQADGKYPLIISFKDGDRRNYQLENLEFLCPNCGFLTGKLSGRGFNAFSKLLKKH